jgi:CHRD domain
MTTSTRIITKLEVLAIASSLAFATLGASDLAALTNNASPSAAFAQQQQQPQTFTAKLAGNNEVPPVSTPATGIAQFQLSADGKELNYDLTTTNLQGFMMAHIHQGKAGENGQPVAPLSMGKGKITSSDLKGPLAGKQLSDLADLMKSGGAYANIHTQQHQDGEIRGQIMSGTSG